MLKGCLALAAQLRRRDATPGKAGEDGELDHQDALALRRDLAAAHDREAALVADVRQLEALLDVDAEASAPTPSVLYPSHKTALVIDGKVMSGQFVQCGTGAALVLMQQVKREPDGNRLFCLRCNINVPASEEEHEQAARAANAEGWRMPPPRTPGDLSEATRCQLVGLLRLATDPDSHVAKELADTKGAHGFGLGYVEGAGNSGRGTLTAAGCTMAERIEHPEVPASITRQTHRTGYLKDYAKQSKEPKARKPKPIEPSVPMVCACSHGVASHTSSSPRDLGSACRESGCKCWRYAQIKVEKPKAAKRSKVAAA